MPIKFEVRNRWTGNIQFTADLDCDENVSLRLKMGLAVKWAYKSDADLRGADPMTGKPYRPDYFQKLWRSVRDAQGVSQAIWNRDLRAGGSPKGAPPTHPRTTLRSWRAMPTSGQQRGFTTGRRSMPRGALLPPEQRIEARENDAGAHATHATPIVQCFQ